MDPIRNAHSEESDTNHTVFKGHAENQSVYAQILLLNERQTELYCQMTDLETGNVADIATLLSVPTEMSKLHL